MRLAGKVALISGAARGMGAVEAELFAREGASVVVGDVLEAEAKKVVEAIEKAGGKALSVRLDVTLETDWHAAVTAAAKTFGKLDVLVNNAGIGGTGGLLADTSLEDWNRTMAVNSTGVFLGTRAAIPAMRAAGGGSIINISSQLGLVGVETTSAQYQASKGAVRLLTKATAIQYAKERIRCNSVHPGPIVTPMTEAGRANADRYKLMVSRIPLGRYGEPGEVAFGVLFLASDESSFVTGSELVIDGGWTAQQRALTSPESSLPNTRGMPFSTSCLGFAADHGDPARRQVIGDAGRVSARALAPVHDDLHFPVAPEGLCEMLVQLLLAALDQDDPARRGAVIRIGNVHAPRVSKEDAIPESRTIRADASRFGGGAAALRQVASTAFARPASCRRVRRPLFSAPWPGRDDAREGSRSSRS